MVDYGVLSMLASNCPFRHDSEGVRNTLNKPDNTRLDLLIKAVEILVENPYLSNVKVAKLVGCDEGSIRRWKKLDIWKEEEQKILKIRMEVAGNILSNIAKGNQSEQRNQSHQDTQSHQNTQRYQNTQGVREQNEDVKDFDRTDVFETKRRIQYQANLEKQQDDLKLFLEAIKATGVQSLKLANKTYTELGKMDNPVKACQQGTKAGVHFHVRTGMDAVKEVDRLIERIYQIDRVLEYMEQQIGTDDYD